jgi:predicted nucleotidyltransferase
MKDETSPAEALGDAFAQAIGALNEARASYALIGGFAVACHGLPRATQDIDFVISVPSRSLPGLLEKFSQRGFAFDLKQVIRELEVDHISKVRCGRIRVDLLDAVLPVFRRVVERAVSFQIRGQAVRVASPEDLIVLKMIASRSSDLDDVRSILAAKRDSLDLPSLRRAVAEVCDEKACRDLDRLLEEQSGG